ncbi:hypothetical protein TRSC58_00301 [Trypanosoma rangeli SC58]|uniref:Uncharacterized protein n=1 Tax=Trypanosoma rangeli SC58 TaxID=429131 RepID=A0A061JC46_TRYRA|nr:hypothetical protein TRSC58_00301 [Trypanosoma rangeli SC58]
MCEEECCTRLDIWHCPLTAGPDADAASFGVRFSDGALPAPMYSVHVGRHVAASMDWLPLPLDRRDNNTLGLCTFIRGRYLVSTVLPRSVVAEAVATAGAGDTSGRHHLRCPNVAAEVCGATLLKREIDLAEVRWSSNGGAVAETFLFAIGRCTSVVVLQPTGDTHSGRLTLQVVHHIEAKGVAALPPFVPSPPIAIGTARGGHTMLVVSHGMSVACYRAPEFSTRLFVAVDDVVCALRCHERGVTVGLASGAVVDVSGGAAVATLLSPPLLIDCVAGDDTWLLANAAGECIRVRRRPKSGEAEAETKTECVFALSRVPRAAEQPATLLIGRSRTTASLRSASDSVASFVQHPLQHLMAARSPLLAFFPDGAWVLAPL